MPETPQYPELRVQALPQADAMDKTVFGHESKQHFCIAEDFVNLNHGAFGSVPRPVQEECSRLTTQVEANPDQFMWFTYEPLLTEVRARVASLIGAESDECVFVANVATGINTVLRNFDWHEDDILVITSTAFNTVYSAAYSISDVGPNPSISEFTLSFPEAGTDVLVRFRRHLQTVKAGPLKAGTSRKDRKIVALFDSIISTPGVLLPWREMVQICKDECVWSVVDAAHSIGQELHLNLTQAAPDFWVSSCSKWLYAKRACAVLYVPRRNHHVIKTALPTSVNYLDFKRSGRANLLTTFLWSGSIDYVVPLSIKPALDFRASVGGEEKINEYCHKLALAGGKRLAEILGTHMMYASDAEERYIVNMVNVELPIPATVLPSMAVTHAFQDKLLNTHKVYATEFFHNGKWWTRPSAQIYNEISDFEKLGEALLVVCKEVTDEFKQAVIE